MNPSETVYTLIIKKTGVDPFEVNDTTDIVMDLGCDGDDFQELMEEYAKALNVDMTDFRWYFHYVEEGSLNNIGGWFFKPPYKRVERIAVTPWMLVNFAIKGKWDMVYPQHQLPARRWDIIINQCFILVFLLLLILHYFVL